MARLACGRSRDHEQVPSRTDPARETLSHECPQSTTNPIPLNGAADRSRRRQPDARFGPIGPQPAEDQQWGRARGSLTAEGLEVRAAPEHRQHGHVLRVPQRSDGEPLAPLGSTTSEHAPTALRSHPGHEAVLALARALLGLIGPLRHGCVPFPRSTFAFRASHTRTAGVPPACAHEEVARLALIGDSTGAPVPWSNACVRRWTFVGDSGCDFRGAGISAIDWPFAAPSEPRDGGDGRGNRDTAGIRVDSLPRRIGRCYSGEPRPGPPTDCPIRPVGALIPDPIQARNFGSETLD